jgi:hypothetical protein
MKPSIKSLLNHLDKQFISALLLFLLLSMVLIILFFKNSQHIEIQLVCLAGIALLALLFALFNLWKINQVKGWISLWANHPVWVIFTFLIFPCLLILLWNTHYIFQSPPAEFVSPNNNFLLPHFLFTYFWQALIFGIAFLAHPDRKKVTLNLSRRDFLLGLLLGLGSWAIIMFANEILLQVFPANLPYQTQAPVFWTLLPMALLFTPITTGYLFFYVLPTSLQGMPPILSACLRTLLFCLLPFRLISLFPAFLFSILFSVYMAKKGPLPALLIAYVFFNLCMILLNWQWVL